MPHTFLSSFHCIGDRIPFVHMCISLCVGCMHHKLIVVNSLRCAPFFPYKKRNDLPSHTSGSWLYLDTLDTLVLRILSASLCQATTPVLEELFEFLFELSSSLQRDHKDLSPMTALAA